MEKFDDVDDDKSTIKKEIVDDGFMAKAIKKEEVGSDNDSGAGAKVDKFKVEMTEQPEDNDDKDFIPKLKITKIKGNTTMLRICCRFLSNAISEQKYCRRRTTQGIENPKIFY